MTTNQITGMNGLANVLNGMFDRIEDQKVATGVSGLKFAETAGVGNSLTVTYKDANGVEQNIDVPNIDLPKGMVTGETLASVLKKLDDVSNDVKISPESMTVLKQVAEEFVTKIGNRFRGTPNLNNVGGKPPVDNGNNVGGKPPVDNGNNVGGKLPTSPVNSAPSVYSIIQEALYLLIECANEQAKTARQGKLASQLQQYAAVLGQASAQESNAVIGMITAVVSGALQLVVTWAMAGESNESKQLKCDNGVQTAQGNLANAKLTGNLEKANTAMVETAKKLEIPETVQNTVEKSVSGNCKQEDVQAMKPDSDGNSAGRVAKLEQGVKVAEAKANLEKVASGGEVKFKPEGETNERSMTLEEAQNNFKTEVDKAVELYKADADNARNKYMALRDNPGSTDAEKKAAHEELKNAQNDYQYASAARTSVLSQSVDGKDGVKVPVLSREGVTEVIQERRGEFGTAKMNHQADPNVAKLADKMSPEWKREMGLQLFRSIESAVQSGIKMLDAEATRKGAEKVKAEQDADSWEGSWQAARKLIDSVLSFMEAQNASIRNSNMA